MSVGIVHRTRCWFVDPSKLGFLSGTTDAIVLDMYNDGSPKTLASIEAQAARHHLVVMGAFNPDANDETPADTGTLILFGPREAGFWDHFTASNEYLDEKPDSLDRWSTRVIGALARELGGTAHFPFGGPPYAPFIQWAVRTGRAWPSPVGLLVHESAGLYASYRGAITIKERLATGAVASTPCDSCKEKPCMSACPADAMDAMAYDVPKCHAYLDTPDGNTCMTQGCQVRAACPVSQRANRKSAQNAFHMRAFHS